MPTVDELETILKKLVEATQQARMATGEAHAARRDLHQAVKTQRDAIAEQILAEVRQQVDTIRDDTRASMIATVNEQLDQLVADLRTKLGLSR